MLLAAPQYPGQPHRQSRSAPVSPVLRWLVCTDSKQVPFMGL